MSRLDDTGDLLIECMKTDGSQSDRVNGLGWPDPITPCRTSPIMSLRQNAYLRGPGHAVALGSRQRCETEISGSDRIKCDFLKHRVVADIPKPAPLDIRGPILSIHARLEAVRLDQTRRAATLKR